MWKMKIIKIIRGNVVVIRRVEKPIITTKDNTKTSTNGMKKDNMTTRS